VCVEYSRKCSHMFFFGGEQCIDIIGSIPPLSYQLARVIISKYKLVTSRRSKTRAILVLELILVLVFILF